MQLNFEIQENIGVGTQPTLFHSPDNFARVVYVDDGTMEKKSAETPLGIWDNPQFEPAPYECIAPDEGVEYLKSHYAKIPLLGYPFRIWFVWHSAERHRLALFPFLSLADQFWLAPKAEDFYLESET